MSAATRVQRWRALGEQRGIERKRRAAADARASDRRAADRRAVKTDRRQQQRGFYGVDRRAEDRRLRARRDTAPNTPSTSGRRARRLLGLLGER